MADQSPLGMFGFMPGKLFNSPVGAASNQPRPFGRGEYMNNPDGTWSSEMTYTVNNPAYGPVNPDFNGGKPTVIPGLWIKDGKPYHATEDEAMQFANQSGFRFPAYGDAAQAEDVANAREAAWQKVPRERAAMGAPLFVPPQRPGLFGGSR